MSTLSTLLATCVNSTFTSNSAYLSQGGAWSFEKEGALSVSGSTFTTNNAPYGGAVAGSQYLTLTIAR